MGVSQSTHTLLQYSGQPDPLLAQFQDPNADIILQSREGTQFRTYKSLLSLVSPIFKDMLAIGDENPPSLPEGSGNMPAIQVVELPEDAATLTVHPLLLRSSRRSKASKAAVRAS
jgi:hypothetical protein